MRPQHAAPSNDAHRPEKPPGRSVARTIGLVLAWLLITVGAVIGFFGRWIVRNFGHITVDQALLNLQGEGEGAGGTFVWSAIWQAVILPIALVFAAWLVIYLFSKRQRRESTAPRRPRTKNVIAALVLIAVPTMGAWSLGSALQIDQYVASHDPSLNLNDCYQAPQVTGTPPEPVNLVLIYLESIEDAFADTSVFGTNMLEPIQTATADWDSVSTLEQYPAGGWTMSGIVSTQCGVPLRMPPSSGITGTETLDHSGELNKLQAASYLSTARCLGDVLQERGYTNVYMGGASADFAAKGVFLADHGYTQVKDRDYWKRAGETEVTDAWGLSDRRLFENAELELEKLEAAGQPFSLTLLTLDTHDPVPQFDYCEAVSAQPLTNATHCSMSAVARFIDFMAARGYLENTAVVVMGDHLKLITTGEGLGATFTDYPDRTIFNRVSSPVAGPVQVNKIDQLDMYPTILEAMGISLEDGRAGVGVSAYNPGAVLGSLRQLDEEAREAVVKSRSAGFYAQLWDE